VPDAPSLLNTQFDPDPDTPYLQAAGMGGGGGGIDWAKAAKLLGNIGGASAGAPAGGGRMPPAQMPLTSLNRPLPQPPANTGNTQEQALIAQLSDAIRRAQVANSLTNQQR
jgi:hypothetical protein